MKNNSIIIIVLVSIFTLFIGYSYFNDNEKTINEDAINFKEEYEKLNDKVNRNNNKKYPTVDISENNVVKYSSYDEVLQVLESGTGVIYLGYPECPWCRNLVPVLLSSAREMEVDTIYYLNIKEDRDLLMLNEKKEIITEKEGSKDYYKLVDALTEILDDYILTTNEGEEVNTGKKRIYVPLVVFVKDGKIVGHHADTVETQTDPYVSLTDKEEEKLLMILINLMGKVNGTLCDEKC